MLLPHVTLYLTFDTVCSNASSITMSGGSPAGGTYTGQGISNGQFVPAIADIGYDSISALPMPIAVDVPKNAYEFAYTEICTGIESLSARIFAISPNPTQGYLGIESNNPNERYTAGLVDLTGRLISSLAENSFIGRTTIAMSNLPSGIDCLSIACSGAVIQTEKIVKF